MEEQVQLSVSDLANIKQIIDTAASRGAFKTDEFKVVGEVCDRLGAFLASAKQPAQCTQASESEETKENEE